jgi:RimJ/RimL family protein N-acetyltransferase
MAELPSISSARLDLVSMSPDFIAAVLAGHRDRAAALLGSSIPDAFPDPHDERFLDRRLEQMRRDPAAQQWLGRAIVERDADRIMVGHAGFHGEPGVNGPGRPRALEIGYTVFPDHRGRGYATEAAVALMNWARRERGVHHFVASVAPSNHPSLAIVQKLGFVQTGEQWDDEDGLELVFERVLDEHEAAW